jgi:tetratricopeptide (TPR) repeat protein
VTAPETVAKNTKLFFARSISGIIGYDKWFMPTNPERRSFGAPESSFLGSLVYAGMRSNRHINETDMSSDKKKIATDCWKSGNDSVGKEDWDYAIRMYGTSVSLVPENLVYRQTLRGAQCKKYNNNKTGANKIGKVKLIAIRGRIKKTRMMKDWKAMDKAAEEGLLLNPWDGQLNFDMGDACRNIGLNEVAKFGFEKAVEADPKNIEFLRNLALILEERGSYSDASQCWDQIHKLDPMDSDARSKITQLHAMNVMRKGGYEDAKNTQDVKTAYDYDSSSGQQRPSKGPEGPGESQEADLQRAIRKDESNKDHYLKLADFYQHENRHEEAAKLLKTALDLSGGDPNIRELLEDAELDLLSQNLDLAKETSKADPDDETARKNTAALVRELLNREIEVLNSRVERYDRDSRIKFELAQRYMRLKNWEKAIPLLQGASSDQRIGTEVLVALGECFFNNKQKELAQWQFEKASESIDQHDHPDLFKKVHYALGVLAELAGDSEKAANYYQEILSIDYEYRDVLKRLEKLQAGGDSEKKD